VGKVTSSYNAIRRYTGDSRVSLRLHAKDTYVFMTLLFKYRVNVTSTAVTTNTKCFKVSKTEIFLLTMCLRISYDTNITSKQPYLLTHNDAARTSDYTALNIGHLTGKRVVKQATDAVVD